MIENNLYEDDNICLAAAKSLQSCPTLCDPIDGSPPGSPVPGILKARTLEWVAISFSNAWKWRVKVKSLSRVRFLATPWTAAYQAPASMGFSRQEYWSGVPLPSPSMIEQMLEIWSSVPLLFLNPACTSGSSRFMYCWSLAWRILTLPFLLVKWVQLYSNLNILWHCLSLVLEWKLTFSSPVATAEFSRFAGILSVAP